MLKQQRQIRFPAQIAEAIIIQMQKKSKKILITTESHEITVVLRNGEKVIHGFCRECAKQVHLLSLDSAVTLTGKRAIEILSLFEQGEVHSFETTDGHLVICENSLIQWMK